MSAKLSLLYYHKLVTTAEYFKVLRASSGAVNNRANSDKGDCVFIGNKYTSYCGRLYFKMTMRSNEPTTPAKSPSVQEVIIIIIIIYTIMLLWKCPWNYFVSIYCAKEGNWHCSVSVILTNNNWLKHSATPRISIKLCHYVDRCGIVHILCCCGLCPSVFKHFN